MAQSNQRLVLDLDDIERQLREAHLPPQPPKSDPLSELARIVGQNDPFRMLIAGDKSARRAAPPSRDELFVDPAPYPGHEPADLHLSRSDRAAGHAYPAEDEAADEPTGEEFQPLERRRSRKGLITVGVVLGLGVVGVAGALVLRKSGEVGGNGEPPVISASKEPLKVQPENPGGVEIPNQNAQVYERGAQDKQTRVVNREEQPIDVQQAARAAQAVVPPSTATPMAPTPQLSQNNAVASLGEPKRVRTVSVRPDGTIVGPDQPPSAPPAPGAPQAAAGIPALTGATTPSAAQRPRPEPRPAPVAETATPAQTGTASRPAPSPAPAAQNGPMQIAPNAGQPAQAPQRTAAIPPRPAAPASAETTNAAGGFTVQLSVQNTEEEARKQYQGFQRKYAAQLGGRAPLIRSADINGKTIYRVRVGPMSRDHANELCGKLKAAGGPCFVAKN